MRCPGEDWIWPAALAAVWWRTRQSSDLSPSHPQPLQQAPCCLTCFVNRPLVVMVEPFRTNHKKIIAPSDLPSSQPQPMKQTSCCTRLLWNGPFVVMIEPFNTNHKLLYSTYRRVSHSLCNKHNLALASFVTGAKLQRLEMVASRSMKNRPDSHRGGRCAQRDQSVEHKPFPIFCGGFEETILVVVKVDIFFYKLAKLKKVRLWTELQFWLFWNDVSMSKSQSLLISLLSYLKKSKIPVFTDLFSSSQFIFVP